MWRTAVGKGDWASVLCFVVCSSMNEGRSYLLSMFSALCRFTMRPFGVARPTEEVLLSRSQRLERSSTQPGKSRNVEIENDVCTQTCKRYVPQTLNKIFVRPSEEDPLRGFLCVLIHYCRRSKIKTIGGVHTWLNIDADTRRFHRQSVMLLSTFVKPDGRVNLRTCGIGARLQTCPGCYAGCLRLPLDQGQMLAPSVKA